MASSLRMRFRTATGTVVAAIVLLTVIAPVLAQNGDDIQILAVDNSEHPRIELTVAIPPELGEGPLNGSDFALTEQGSPRPIAINTIRDEIEVILAIDTSGSMRPNNALTRAKEAAAALVEGLPESTVVGVVGFGSTTLVASELTGDRAAVLAAIASLDFSGDTALWDALVVSAEQFNPQENVSRYVVVLTDGENDGGASSQEQAVAALAAKGVSLYAIGLETGEPNFDDLESTSESVGGGFIRAESIEDLAPLFAEIGDRLANRYRLVFEAEGFGERELIISVATEGGLATVRRTIDLGGTAPVLDDDPEESFDFPPVLNSRVSPGVDWLGQSWNFWAGTLSFFGAFALLAFLILRPAQRIRLAAANEHGDRVANFSNRLTGAADQALAGSERGSRLDHALDAAGMEVRPGELVVFVLVGTAVAGLSGLALVGALFGFLLAAFVPFFAFVYVSRKLNKRREDFADQLSDTLTVMAGALRAGRGLPQTLDLVAQETAVPTRDEFQRVIIESRVGRDLAQSLESVATRMKNDDFQWVAEAVAINRELGGDLAEILDNIASIVRDRNQVRLQVKALAAEGRLSGYVLIALPIALFFYIQIVNPDYGAQLLSGTGLVALIAGILAMIGGALWIRNLVKLDY